MITNPRRKKRIEEFVDKNHKVMSEYYDLLESATSEAQLKREMNKMIVSDPDFYDPYLVVADLEMEGGHNERGRQLIHEAYERAVKRIADAQGDWPKCMLWGWLENRHLMRALEREAIALWEEKMTEEALDIFRRLLRANPGDNQGVRHFILAIRLGLGTDWYTPFEVKDGPMAGEAIDAMAVSDWFEKNAKKFREEFGWWRDAMKELGYDE